MIYLSAGETYLGAVVTAGIAKHIQRGGCSTNGEHTSNGETYLGAVVTIMLQFCYNPWEFFYNSANSFHEFGGLKKHGNCSLF